MQTSTLRVAVVCQEQFQENSYNNTQSILFALNVDRSPSTKFNGVKFLFLANDHSLTEWRE